MNSSLWVVVTGSGGGIGNKVVETLIDKKWNVICIDKKIPNQKLKNKFKNLDKSAELIFIDCDLSKIADEENCKSIKIKLKNIQKGKKIAALVHLAAIQNINNFSKLTLKNWKTSIDINLLAPVEMNKLFLENLCKNKGSIVHVGSIHSQLTKPNFCLYATTKAAINGLTKSMAVELGGAIRVNCVEPAAISTPMLEEGFKEDTERRKLLDSYHPSGFIGNPIDVAKSILFLIDPKNCFVNGCIINLDGGISSRLHDPK